MSDASVQEPTDGSDGLGSEPGATSSAGMSASTAGMSAPAAETGGRGGNGGMPAAPAAGAGGCSGAECATNTECKVDADCIPRGGPHATCADSKCFAPIPQCEKDEDCAKLGPEYVGGRCADQLCLPNPRWRCEPPPVTSPSDTIEMILPVVDALQLGPVANVKLLACSKLDFTCMQPIGMATTGMNGEATFTLPANFAGYFQQTERNDYVPAMYFMPTKLPDNKKLSNFPLIVSGTTFTGFGLVLGTTIDPMRGHIMLIVEDCMGTALAGVQFSSPQADSKTTGFYVRDQIPNASAKDTPVDGTGGFVNLPMGPVDIVAKEMATGITLATATVLIRPGYISTAYIRPMPRGTVMTGRFPLD